MASIRKRVRKNGTPSWQVMFRDEDGTQSSVTFLTEPEAITLKRALDANGGNFAIAQGVVAPATGVRTVADVVREHIDMLVRPGPQTIVNYNAYLKNHIMDSIGGVPIDKLNRQQVSAWVAGLMKKSTGGGRTMAPKTVRSIHVLLVSSIDTAVKLEYVGRNVARGVDLPSLERADDDTMFLTLKEFQLIRSHMEPRYQTFITFLVMTGARFGEATALTVANINLASNPATVRIVRAWKSDGHGGFYIGPPKSKTSKRTVTIPGSLVELLRPLVDDRPSDALLFVDSHGGRIKNQRFFHTYWRAAIAKAQKADPNFRKQPKVHHLRHTHASWLVQEGVDMFKLARRLGHSDTSMLDERYAHLMPEAQLEMASAIGRAMLGEGFVVKEISE